MTTPQADVIVVGAGLAGLVAATELADAGRRVLVLDQEGEQNLGGQAFWSLGGLFLIDSPEAAKAILDGGGLQVFKGPENYLEQLKKLWAVG